MSHDFFDAGALTVREHALAPPFPPSSLSLTRCVVCPLNGPYTTSVTRRSVTLRDPFKTAKNSKKQRSIAHFSGTSGLRGSANYRVCPSPADILA